MVWKEARFLGGSTLNKNAGKRSYRTGHFHARQERRSWLRTLAPDNAADLIRNPASASAPAAATLVDVSGLIIYFSVARVIMLGVLPGESES